MEVEQSVVGPKCLRCSKNVVWQNVWINLILGLFKGAISIIGGSEALIADAMHSMANAVMAGIIGVSLKISNKPADKNHPYGHGKAEFLFTVAVALLFMAGAFLLLFISVKSVLYGSPSGRPRMVAAWATIVSIIVNEIVFRRTLCASRRINSLSIGTNAWGSRTDMFSSVAALAGILFAKLGLDFMDPLAAVFVSLLIVKISVKILQDAASCLVDVSLPSEEIEEIRNIAASVNGVKNVSDIKTRRMGRLNWIDIEIDLKPQITITEADDITAQVRKAVSDGVDHVGNVVVYFRPEESFFGK
ncbi:cation diffusion facilitator family transporter [Candidatus Poribacteria bacterium]